MKAICNANNEFTKIVAHQGQHMIHDKRVRENGEINGIVDGDNLVIRSKHT